MIRIVGWISHNTCAFLRTGGLSVVLMVMLSGCGGIYEPERVASRLCERGPDELSRVWKELGISSELSLAKAGDRLSVDIIAPPVTVSVKYPCRILRITNGTRWDWQYLMFVKRVGCWRFVGQIDLPMQKYKEPVHRFVAVAPDVLCITLRELSCSGTGCLLYEEAWYEWAEGHVRKVLRYPIEGHVFGWGMSYGRTFVAKVDRDRDCAGRALSLTVTMMEEFFREQGNEEPVPLFNESRSIVFVWDASRRAFRPDVRWSVMTTNELDGVWNDGSVEFVDRHLERLIQFLKTGTLEEQQWAGEIIKKSRVNRQRGENG